MNTIRSTWVGWGALCAAGGGAYFFAKRSINASRAERHEAVMRAKQEAASKERADMNMANPPAAPSSPSLPTPDPQAKTEKESPTIGAATAASAAADSQDVSGHPSTEIQKRDPAPTRHEPDTIGRGVIEKGKYEAAEEWRSRKGPRLSG
ncbi:hypothetical protein KEM54_001652 [Ascosphaera aggregata]|nr:hypothetical protein KEM54_001652 [Ascosphaera aggregata]